MLPSRAAALSPRAAALGLVTLLCLVCCARALMDPLNHTVFLDYAHAGSSWMNGADAYEIQRDNAGNIVPRMSGYRYSPLVSIFLVPFSFLPLGAGGALWRLLNCLVFIAAFAWFIRAVGAAYRLSNKGQAALWLLILPLSLGSIHNGQANVLLMGLLLAAAAAVAQERWNWASGFLAGACLLKIYPLAVALLFLVAYPRQLSWRFLVALALGLALPFVLQDPSYVYEQYRNWYDLVATDNRRDYPMDQGYRDFYLMTRFFGAPMTATAYLILQLGAAALSAAMCLRGQLLNWPKTHLVQTVLGLGCCWMVVFGPSTESCTFILIAPTLALAILEFPPSPLRGRGVGGEGARGIADFRFQIVDSSLQSETCNPQSPPPPHPNPLPRRGEGARLPIPALAMAMFVLTFTATWFPGGRNWFYVLQPLSAALFYMDRLVHAKPKQEAADTLARTLSQAA